MEWMSKQQKIFSWSVIVWGTLMMGTLLGISLYRRGYAPLDYHLSLNYPQARWARFIEQREGTSSLWKEGSAPPLIGAYPYQTEGTFIYQFAYPFTLGQVHIQDQHSQWGEGDRVRLWTSLDGSTWTLQYDDNERSTVVAFSKVINLSTNQTKTFYIKYALYAGDRNRATDDNRGATIREFHLQVIPGHPLLLKFWKLLKFVILPASFLIMLLSRFWCAPMGMHDRIGVLLLLGFALALRLWFVTHVEHPPLYGDPADYDQKALAITALITGDFSVPPQESYFEKTIVNIAEKGPLYPLLLASVYLVYGEQNFQIVRVLQAILDVITCCLVYFIGKRIFSGGTGWLALIFAACYLPFMVSVGLPMQETFAMLLLCATVLLFIHISKQPSWRYRGYIGMVLGLTILSRYALNFLLIPFSAAFCLKRWNDRLPAKYILKEVAVLCAGLGLTLGLWVLLFWGTTGQVSMSTSMRHYRGLYKGLYAWGQQVDHIHVQQNSLLEEILKRHGSQHPSFEELREAFSMTILKHPFQALVTMLHRLYYYWKYAYNDFYQVPFGTLRGHGVYHQVIVLFGLWGIGCTLSRWSQTMFLVIPIAYLVLINMIVSVELRQAVLAFPFLMVFAAALIELIITYVWSTARHLTRRVGSRLALCTGCIGLCGALASVFPLPIALTILPEGFSPRFAYLLNCGWIAGLLVAVSLLTYLMLVATLRHEKHVRWWAICGTFVSLSLISLVWSVYALTNHEWREWQTRLITQEIVVQQEILLPNHLPEFSEAMLKIDVQSGVGHYYDLDIRVNGQLMKRFEHGVHPDEEFETYARTGAYPTLTLFMEMRKQRFDDLRQWVTIPIDAALLRSDNTLQIQLQLSQAAGGEPHSVAIYGDYRSPDEKKLPLPAMGFGSTGSSPFKYMIDNDYRLRLTEDEIESLARGSNSMSREILGDFTRYHRFGNDALLKSRYFDGQTWRDYDLSNRPGIQSGVYRIRLVLKDRQGQMWVL